MFLKKCKDFAVVLLAGILLTSLSGGCASFGRAAEKKDTTRFPVYGEGLLKAVKSGSYSNFVKDFSRELAQTISERAFDKLREDLKKNRDSIEKWQYLTNLNRAGLYRVDLWKVTFLRDTSSGKQTIERLFLVTSTRLDGKDQIIGFKFDMLF